MEMNRAINSWGVSYYSVPKLDSLSLFSEVIKLRICGKEHIFFFRVNVKSDILL